MRVFNGCVLLILLITVQQSHSQHKRSLDEILLEVRNLNGLSSFTSEHEQIFTPNYVSDKRDHYKHNIHVTDQVGKFMNIYYEAKHPSNANILKMDEKLHKTNIVSLFCKHDKQNTINLHFHSETVATEYYQRVQTTLNGTNKNHFITAGHEWRCLNDNNQYESILREITNIKLDRLNRKKLILHTQKASLLDIFEKLDLEIKTNIGMHQYRVNDNHHYKGNNRKLLSLSSWLGEVTESIVNGIAATVNSIKHTVETVAKTAGKIIAYAMGDPVDFDMNKSYTWRWNYDDMNEAALKTFDLSNTDDDDNNSSDIFVGCTDCYAYMDLEYYYKLHIDDRKVKYLKMKMNGETKINIDITAKKQMNASLTIPTVDIPIPDLSFEIAGFKFSVYIEAQISIGVIISVDTFAFQFSAAGYITKGILHDYEQGIQKYYDENDFSYTRNGPKMEYKSANIVVYAQPTLYLTLEHVGSLYFGIEPRLNLVFEKNDQLSDSVCAIYYTPSLLLTPFIGFKLDILGFTWHKELKFKAIQPTISDWGGCVEQAKITKIQTVKSDVTYYDASNWTNYNWSQSFENPQCAYINMDSIIYPIGLSYCSIMGANNSYYFTCSNNSVYIVSFTNSAYCNGESWREKIEEDVIDYNCDGDGFYCNVVYNVINFYNTSEYDQLTVEHYKDYFYNKCLYELYYYDSSIWIPTVVNICSAGHELFCQNDTLYRNISVSDDCSHPVSISDRPFFVFDDGVICSVTIGCDYYSGDRRRRRRMIPKSNEPKSINIANAFIDVSQIDIGEFRTIKGWGSPETEWWANMSVILDICNEWTITCHGYSGFSILSPTKATLLVHVIDNSTLIAIYHTDIEVTPYNGWDLVDAEIYANVSCIARHQLTLKTNSDHDDIPTYDVELLEWNCDTNLSSLGINASDDLHYSAWQCMITLPSEMNSMALDSSFGNIMLFDITWCQVFSLTKKPKYTLNYAKIENINWNTFQYPSRLWYGIWNCHENTSTNTELYFIGYNHSDGYIEAILFFDANRTYAYYLEGSINLLNMTMQLDVLFDYQYNEWIDYITMIGIINILYDGTITYSGSINSSGCTGFLFQGYLNMTQFDYIMTNKSNQTSSTTISTPVVTQTTENINDMMSTTINTETENINSKSMVNTEGVTMFVIGMFTSLMIIAVIFVVCKWRNKKKISPSNYQLMTGDKL